MKSVASITRQKMQLHLIAVKLTCCYASLIQSFQE